MRLAVIFLRQAGNSATPVPTWIASHTLVGSIIYHVALLRRELEPARVEQLVDQAIALLGARRGSPMIET